MNNIFYTKSICTAVVSVRKITPEKYYRSNKYKEIFIVMLLIKSSLYKMYVEGVGDEAEGQPIFKR